ncbi:MAG: hypothetical protein E7672_06285 [Ruminococcaceae bacterium]|nr:hypothetical protein [Oscillospiraceae bacterium]
MNVNDINKLSDKEYFDSCFEPVIRFAVTSDVHITEHQVEERLALLFEKTYEYAESHESYNKLDGVFVAGDFGHRGYLPVMEKFFGIVNAKAKEETVVRAVLGNHEFFEDVPAVENLLKASGYDSPDAHLVIGGFHFICLSPSFEDGFGNEKKDWLEKEMEIAAADDPTGKKPIFVFQHHPLIDTVLGSKHEGVENLREVLNNYPQAVDFAGHSHVTVLDPRSVWQGEFTALGTGALNYITTDIAGVRGGASPIGREGGYGRGSSRDTIQFYIVEVDANYAIKVNIYDVTRRELLPNPILIRSVGDVSKFVYTDARAERSEKPVFAPDSEIVIIDEDETSVKMLFSQATCKDTVQHYACELYKGDELVHREYRLSCSYYYPIPKNLTVSFDELTAGEEYTLKITAVNPWGKMSDSREFRFVHNAIDFSEIPDEEYFEKYFIPTVRFAVTSDVHLGQECGIEDEHLKGLFETSFKYADSHDKYGKLDGVFFTGDITDSGEGGDGSMIRFFNIVDENSRETTYARAVLGNHETGDKAERAVERLCRIAGYDSPDEHFTMSGFHFIMISPYVDGTGWGFDETKQAWLEKEMEIAAADDPTGKKPIFVFRHHNICGTVAASTPYGAADVKYIMKRYQQAVDFSGHSHFPINDPRCIWQGHFTAFSCGTLHVLETDVVGIREAYTTPSDKEGGWGKKPPLKEAASMFYIVEADARNSIKVQIFDINTGTVVGKPYLIRAVGGYGDFVYVNERKDWALPPVFSSDAKAEIIEKGENSVKIRFPQASCDDTVQHYRCMLCKGEQVLKTEYRLSCSYLIPTPETLTVTFDELEAGEYTVKILAVSPWEKISEPLSFEFEV